MGMSKEESFRSALAQPGGGRRITYRDLVIVVPIYSIEETFELFSETDDRTKMMTKVNTAINDRYPKLQQLSTDEVMDLVQDIVIWFVNEIYEGREFMTETIN